MPYVALEPSHRQARLALAEARWASVLALRPDLEAPVTLQRDLIGIVIDLLDTIEGRPLPRLSLPPRYLAAKLRQGTPVFGGEPIPTPVAPLRKAFVALCDALSRGGAGEAADHVKTAVVEGTMDAGSLFQASLARDQHAIRSGASHRGLAPDFVWLVAELTVSPLAYALQHTVLTSQDAQLRAALDDWARGYCPACGSWPALGEVADQHRVLRCSFCAYAWELSTYACVYCGEGSTPFVTASPDAARPDRRVEVCAGCSSYLKAIDVPSLSPFPLLAILDLETTDLDTAAMERGYQRPTLRTFATRKSG